MMEVTKSKRLKVYSAAFVCVLVFVCVFCIPQKAFASSTLCDPACRATFGLGVDRTDSTEYAENGNSVKNLKLSRSSILGGVGDVRLYFDSKTRKGVFTTLRAGFTLVITDRTGKVLAEYYDSIECYWDRTHYLQFTHNDWITGSGDEYAIWKFSDDYKLTGGVNYQAYIKRVSVDEDYNTFAGWGIIQHPTNQTVITGQSATFTIQTSGNYLSYQWHIDRNDGKGWIEIDGANTATYVTSVADVRCDGFRYYCKVINPEGGEIDSAEAALHVAAIPKTGDSSRPYLWLTILLTSVFAILIRCKRQKIDA